MRTLIVVGLCAFASFCAYGFVASFEPTKGALAWRVGYAVLCALTALLAWRVSRWGDSRP